ncbi:hypothetical protein CRUP_005052 [Coryphaenoides rupestris]|nr:hypothetical protein CRUP_005052 [Coryphaenoides rupestris]
MGSITGEVYMSMVVVAKNTPAWPVCQSALQSPSRRMPPSDTIPGATCRWPTCCHRCSATVPIFISDLGLEVNALAGLVPPLHAAVGVVARRGLLGDPGAQCFHCATLRRQHVAFGPLAQQRERRRVWLVLGLVWGVNLVFSLPALVYTTHVHGNATVELMVISCTTRPLLGCIWEFPTRRQGSAFASTSLVLNEVAPLVLMICTNLATLHALAKHIRAVTAGGEAGGQAHADLDRHVASERKAGHVIISLVSLFVVCWVLQVAAVTYYNHDGGHHAEGLLTVAHFAASLFVGFSPMVVALGHGKLRKRIVGKVLEVEEESSVTDTSQKKGKPIFIVQKEASKTIDKAISKK